MIKPDPDYVAELEYHHKMYPDEIEKPVGLKEKLVSAVSKGRDILGGIKDARDELYGLNGKKGFGLHLKPVDEMDFLPGGSGKAPDMGFSTPSGDSHRKEKTGRDNTGGGKTVVIHEIHHHHHEGSKKKTSSQKRYTTGKRSDDLVDNFADPGYIPKSLKKLF